MRLPDYIGDVVPFAFGADAGAVLWKQRAPFFSCYARVVSAESAGAVAVAAAGKAAHQVERALAEESGGECGGGS